ncbi:hypothetical protein [Sinomonas flava]
MAERNAPWDDDEIRAVVGVYFRMLESELTSERYVKSECNKEVQARTGRSRGSVEFKFCNISHVLEQGGYPFVDGYKPRRNTQGALVDAVVRRAKACLRRSR